MKKKLTYIAELCQNHNGNIKRLLDMADIAKEAGADYLVIGRPILTAADPAQALDEIIRQISYD